MEKIAILDDDKYWCSAVQRFFRNTFEVTDFSDAISLLEEIEKEPHRYDLIMIDLSLPASKYKDINGRQLIKQIREILPSPPILVLVTAFISKNDLESGEIICKEADAFLGKDGGLEDILQRLQQLLNSQDDPNNHLKFNPRSRW